MLPNIIPVMAVVALGWFSPAGQVDLPLFPFSLSVPVAADGAQSPATAQLYPAPAPHAEMFSRDTRFLWVFNTLCLPSCLLRAASNQDQFQQPIKTQQPKGKWEQNRKRARS